VEIFNDAFEILNVLTTASVLMLLPYQRWPDEKEMFLAARGKNKLLQKVMEYSLCQNSSTSAAVSQPRAKCCEKRDSRQCS
jgi:hypothetical protein